MEDASKEFQVFYAPSMKTNDKKQPNKNRLVPVINKFMTSSNSSFALNQRRCSVYKAVSGVSFQETDVEQQRKNTKKEKKDGNKRESRRERKESQALVSESEKSYSSGRLNNSGSTRSRSVTSIESRVSDLTKGKAEITHPFSPVIIYDQGRKSRYTRAKDRRRSHSHVRYGAIEMSLADNSSKIKDDPPTRPRRSRSASRCRKSVLTAFPSEDSLQKCKKFTENLHKNQAEKPIVIKCEDQTENMSQNFGVFESKSERHVENCERNLVAEVKEIDFCVSDTYWRQCEEMVSRQLDSLNKEDEEPEGGYFSLEREENEELERPSDSVGECFQRDHDNEAIYVEQVFVGEQGKAKIANGNSFDNFNSKSNVINVSNNYSTEVGFVDDEGLYEEIIFQDLESKNCLNVSSSYPTEAHNNVITDMYQNTSQLDRSYPTHICLTSTPKIEQRKLSTVVYITCDDQQSVSDDLISVSIDGTPDPVDSESYSSTVTVNQHDVCQNNLDQGRTHDAISRLEHLYEGHTESANANYESSVEAVKNMSNIGWCSCGPNQENPSVTFNHSASCIQSKSSCLNAKYSLISGKGLTSPLEESFNNHEFTVANGGITLGNASEDSGYDTHAVTITPIKSETRDEDLPYLVEFPEYELSDIDLDMFAPRDKPERRRRKKTAGSSPRMHSTPIDTEPEARNRLSSEIHELKPRIETEKESRSRLPETRNKLSTEIHELKPRIETEKESRSRLPETRNRLSTEIHELKPRIETEKEARSRLPESRNRLSTEIPHFTPRRVRMTSPKTFKAVLEDSIFNPPDTESILGDTEALFITDDQVITCITDSSSDDESDNDEDDSLTTSPWLEAKSEFEFVAFKSEEKHPEDVSKRKKGRKKISLPSIPKIFSSASSLSQSSSSSPSSHSNKSSTSKSIAESTPERPVRRRRRSRSKSSKRQQQQK